MSKFIKKSTKSKKSKFRRRNELSRSDQKSTTTNWLTIKELSTLTQGGYFDEDGVLRTKEGCIQCNAVIKATGRRCKNFSVLGFNYCIWHGGGKFRADNIKNIIYSPFLKNTTLKEAYERAMMSDSTTGIQEELALLRGLLAQTVSIWSSAKVLDTKQLKEVASVIGEIRHLVNSCVSAEVKMGQLIDIGKMTLVIKQLCVILEKYITNPEILERIADEFDDISWPGTIFPSEKNGEKKSFRKIPKETNLLCEGSSGNTKPNTRPENSFEVISD